MTGSLDIMELRHLHSLIAATECGSFTGAAQRLQVTQAAVSQHISALETELGVGLFDRKGRSASATEAGQRLCEYGRRIVALVEKAQREIGSGECEIRGELKIAASTVPAQRLLPSLLARFRRGYPLVRESVCVSDSALATRAVQSGEADVALVGEKPRGAGLETCSIARDELVLVVSVEHDLAGRANVGVEQLRSEPMIVREAGSGSRNCIEQALRSAGLQPAKLNVAMEMNSNEAIRAAVGQGLGVAFLSQSIVEDDIRQEKLARVPVAELSAVRDLYLITSASRTPSPAAQAFVQFAKQSASEA